jgi:hypothetical protein
MTGRTVAVRLDPLRMLLAQGVPHVPLEFSVGSDFVVRGMARDLVGRYLPVSIDDDGGLHFAPEARRREAGVCGTASFLK